MAAAEPRHTALEALLAASSPAVTTTGKWPGGNLQLSTHVGAATIPEELVTSVRCVTLVGHQVVVCTNRHGISHAWPGGGREAGESYVETAVREVHEETGWQVDPESVEPVGWLHIRYLDPKPDHHPWPYPDCLQLVVAARAEGRAETSSDEWTDTEGYELRSVLMRLDEALSSVEPNCRPFLELLRNARV